MPAGGFIPAEQHLQAHAAKDQGMVSVPQFRFYDNLRENPSMAIYLIHAAPGPGDPHPSVLVHHKFPEPGPAA